MVPGRMGKGAEGQLEDDQHDLGNDNIRVVAMGMAWDSETKERAWTRCLTPWTTRDANRVRTS